MYNTTCTVTYESSESYQAALLEVFELCSADLLCECIDKVYASAPGLVPIVATIAAQTFAPVEMAHFFLFSYDYFTATHAYLCRWIISGEDDVSELTRLVN